MKKFVLSLAVIAMYVAYSVISRHQATGMVLVPKTASGQTATTTGSQASSSTSSTSGSGTTGIGSTPTTSSSSSAGTGSYKDGTYTGSEADAFYGLIKVAVTISGGKITAVNFLEHPTGNPNSDAINQQAMPYLQQEAIQAQSAHVNVISGATDTSQAFVQSLSSALSQAM